MAASEIFYLSLIQCLFNCKLVLLRFESSKNPIVFIGAGEKVFRLREAY